MAAMVLFPMASFSKNQSWDFHGGSVVKTLPSVAGVAGLIPGQGAMIPGASRPKNQNIKQKQNCNKFNKDFKTGPHQQRNLKKKKAEVFTIEISSKEVILQGALLS